MTILENRTFDAERALYAGEDILLKNCVFDGPADGESACKEARGVSAEGCLFNLRYPFWHDRGLRLTACELTANCRAALWYSSDIAIEDTKLHGIKALRECDGARLRGCDIASPEFGWSSRHVEMDGCAAAGEYFMLRASHLYFRDVKLTGKYSFQYVEDAVFEHCVFDTKDAFWHAKNVVVRDSVVKGEYLAWYCENVTFENCRIIGTQPLCYCRGLRLFGCAMEGCDLAFERSDVQAEVTTPIISVKNPLAGSRITAPSVGEILRDIPGADGAVLTQDTQAQPA